MKESLLGDKKDIIGEDESEDEEEFESDEETEEVIVEDNQDTVNEELENESKSREEFCFSIIENILEKTFNSIKETEPKTVTSLYGKVYALKPSIKSL